MDKLNKDSVLFHLRAIERQLSMGNGEEFEHGLVDYQFESTFVRYSCGDPKFKVVTKISMTKYDAE